MLLGFSYRVYFENFLIIYYLNIHFSKCFQYLCYFIMQYFMSKLSFTFIAFLATLFTLYTPICLWIFMQRAGLYLLSPANLSGFEQRWTVDGGRHRTWDAAFNQHTEQSGINNLVVPYSVHSTAMNKHRITCTIYILGFCFEDENALLCPNFLTAKKNNNFAFILYSNESNILYLFLINVLLSNLFKTEGEITGERLWWSLQLCLS